jgi:diacylglycerol O-acyltransferase / wax synthase
MRRYDAASMSRFERLQVLDELFLHLEGPNTHMHVGGIAIFEGPAPEYEEVLDMIGARLDMVPRFRQKLATVPFGLGRPVWIDDAHFHLEYHVRQTALPHPGDSQRLKRLVARVMSQQLDRSKPLWEMWVAEGLQGDRFALISKTHHCIIDGISGADIMSVLLDFAPEANEMTATPWRPRPQPTQDELLADAVRERLTSPAEIVRSLQSMLMDPGQIPGRVAEGVQALGAFVGGGFAAPPSSLNQVIGPHRRFETAWAEPSTMSCWRYVRVVSGGCWRDAANAWTTSNCGRWFPSRCGPKATAARSGIRSRLCGPRFPFTNPIPSSASRSFTRR